MVYYFDGKQDPAKEEAFQESMTRRIRKMTPKCDCGVGNFDPVAHASGCPAKTPDDTNAQCPVIIPLGTVVKPWGKVVQVGWVGERYYWLIDKHGTVSMMPASLVEPRHNPCQFDK